MKIIFLIIDLILLPVTLFLSFLFYLIRKTGEDRLVICNKVLLAKGILPTKTYFEEAI